RFISFWSLSTLLKKPSPISSLAASSRCFIPAFSLNCLIFCPIVIDLIYTCPILVKSNNYFSIYQSSGGKKWLFWFFQLWVVCRQKPNVPFAGRVFSMCGNTQIYESFSILDKFQSFKENTVQLRNFY